MLSPQHSVLSPNLVPDARRLMPMANTRVIASIINIQVTREDSDCATDCTKQAAPAPPPLLPAAAAIAAGLMPRDCALSSPLPSTELTA